MKQIKMLAQRTLLIDNSYLLPDDMADQLIADGSAVLIKTIDEPKSSASKVRRKDKPRARKHK